MSMVSVSRERERERGGGREGERERAERRRGEIEKEKRIEWGKRGIEGERGDRKERWGGWSTEGIEAVMRAGERRKDGDRGREEERRERNIVLRQM